MMRFDRFTERAQDAAMRAYEILQRYSHTQADTEHLLLALLEQPDGSIPEILEHLNIDPEHVREQVDEILLRSPRVSGMPNMAVGQVYITPRLKRVLDNAQGEAKNLNDEYVSTEHLFLPIVGEGGTAIAKILNEHGVTKERVLDAIYTLHGRQRVTSPQEPYRTLDKYSRNLNEMAIEGKLDPLIGREEELDRIALILSQRQKNNPLIVGPAGVGKTAIMHGLAQRIATEDMPQALLDKEIRKLDVHNLLTGTHLKGEIQERVTTLLSAIQLLEKEIVLFIDDMQVYLDTEVFDILQSTIARGDIQIIGATTAEAYEEYIKPNVIFSRYFTPLFVKELSVEQTIDVLKALKPMYETHHQVEITDEAIEAAVRLSDRYIRDRYQPDKSIQIIDEAAATLRLLQSKLPPPLQATRKVLTKLQREEVSAGQNQDWERAAQLKVERLRVEQEFQPEFEEWRGKIPKALSQEQILSILSQFIGISKEKLKSKETAFTDFVNVNTGTEMEVSTEDLRLGERFNQKYEVLRLIGQGGVGQVWQVRNRELDRIEAIKVLPLIRSRKHAEQFKREAHIAASLNHPNVVTIYDVGEGSGHRYISMEYVNGPNLAQVIDQKGKLSLKQVQAIAIQLCHGLGYAHHEGVVHRDIKPSNILLSENSAKLADFGVSVLIKETMTELTGSGGGTPSYRSPEQILGEKKKPDIRTDIYSLGVTFYELLTGERPFQGTSIEFKHLEVSPRPPSHLNWEIPPSVDQIILRCLEKNPNNRYESVAELRKDWEELPEPISLTPLAKLMQARFDSKERPYVLVLGEGASLSSGCASTVQIIDTIGKEMIGYPMYSLSWSQKLERFLEFVQGLSETERYTLLKKHYEGLKPSIGYISLAKLIKVGYFDVVFTTNIDIMLERALNHVQMMPFQDYHHIVIEDEGAWPKLQDALEHPTPQVKIVKLHGDINSRKFAFTPQEIFIMSDALEEVLAKYLLGDLIIVGHEKRDEDITRCLRRNGGSLWYVHPNKPSPDSIFARIPRLAKSRKQVIWGENGHFDRFFWLLDRELLGKEKDNVGLEDDIDI